MRQRRDDDKGATITTLSYQGRAIDLCVSSRGLFYAVLIDERIEAKSLDGLKDKVKRQIDRLGKIEIPITVLTQHYDEPPTLADGLLVRLSRGRAVVRDTAGDEDLLGYSSTTLRRPTPDEQQALTVAWDAYKIAEARYNELVENATCNANDLLTTASNALMPPPAGELLGGEERD